MPFPENIPTKFVLRDGAGKVCGVFANRQEDATEELAADDAEIVAFFAPKPADDGPDKERALQRRRADDLAKSPNIDDKLEALRIRLELLGG